MSKDGKLLYLESLRGIAALVVVFTHFATSFLPMTTGGWGQPAHSRWDGIIFSTPLSVLVNGNFFVCVFFVLSGFVLTLGFFQSGRVDALARGALKRYARLMLPVMASVLLSYGLLWFGLTFNHEAANVSGSEWLANLWHFAPDLGKALKQGAYDVFFIGSDPLTSYNNVLWTMQIEFTGSLLVFGMAAVLRGFPKRAWVYLLLVAANWHSYYLGFIFGLMLADLVSQEKKWARICRNSWLMWAGLISLGLLLGGYPSIGDATRTTYASLPNPLSDNSAAVVIWHTIGAAMLILGVLAWSRAQQWLVWKPLVMLGRQSFALYLMHVLVIGSLSSYLFSSLNMSSHRYFTSLGVTFGVSIVVIFALSYLFTRWVDQPAIALARKFAAHREPKPAQQEVKMTVQTLQAPHTLGIGTPKAEG